MILGVIIGVIIGVTPGVVEEESAVGSDVPSGVTLGVILGVISGVGVTVLETEAVVSDVAEDSLGFVEFFPDVVTAVCSLEGIGVGSADSC